MCLFFVVFSQCHVRNVLLISLERLGLSFPPGLIALSVLSAPQTGTFEGVLWDVEKEHPQRGWEEDVQPECPAQCLEIHSGRHHWVPQTGITPSHEPHPCPLGVVGRNSDFSTAFALMPLLISVVLTGEQSALHLSIAELEGSLQLSGFQKRYLSKNRPWFELHYNAL